VRELKTLSGSSVLVKLNFLTSHHNMTQETTVTKKGKKREKQEKKKEKKKEKKRKEKRKTCLNNILYPSV